MKRMLMFIAALSLFACEGHPKAAHVVTETPPPRGQSLQQAPDLLSPPSLPEDIQEDSTLTPDTHESSADAGDSDVKGRRGGLTREEVLECKPPKCIGILH